VSGTPRFSVIVPTFRRKDALARCLDALARQAYPRERFEVVVADDGSGETPSDVVERFSGLMSVSLVEASHGGPGAARNAAAVRARGEHLAMTDDDCVPEPDWLARLDGAVCASPGALVGGRVENGLDDNPMAEASQLLIDYLYEYFASDLSSTIRFFTTNNLAVPAERFRQLGGFDVVSIGETAEDRDLCDRWVRSGGTLVYEPSAVVRHHSPLSFTGFVRQHIRYGRGAVLFHAARVTRGGPPVRLEPLAFYVGMLRHPARRHPGANAIIPTLLVAASQLSYASGYFAQRLRRPRARPTGQAHLRAD
jgi:glycosyltransferase involved in cell wall biosynthesis